MNHIKRFLTPLLLITTAFLAVSSYAATWDHVRGDASGSGFADVVTLPALRPSATVPGLGTFAPGANPVIGPDGTVYLGNEQGELIALHPDGKLFWRRNLGPPTQSILASPVVDIDGSIYVLGVRSYTDHRVAPAAKRNETRLHRFEPGGGLAWTALLPRHYPSVPAFADNGTTTASPSIWRDGAQAAVLIPVFYRGVVSKDVRLLAFSTGGNVIADKLVGSLDPGTVVADPGWLKYLGGMGFCAHSAQPSDPADRLPASIDIPMPPVTTFIYQGGGTPWIIATDRNRSLVGWTFSMGGGFVERFRRSWNGLHVLGAPMVLPDGHSVVSQGEQKYDEWCENFAIENAHISYFGPNAVPFSDVPIFTQIPLARTGDGRIVAVVYFGFTVMRDSNNIQSVNYSGESIAPAAVSRTHIFISTAGSMRTYDVNTLAKVGEVDWFGGGRSGPIIGPQGQVYALASNVLFIWPGPKCATPRCLSVGTHAQDIIKLR